MEFFDVIMKVLRGVKGTTRKVQTGSLRKTRKTFYRKREER